MNITGKYNPNEDEKVKAFINITIGDYQLKGFKVYENDNIELKLAMPSYLDKKAESEEPIYKHPIVINPVLQNKGAIFRKLESAIIGAYNECKGMAGINKDVNEPELEKGELNVANTWVVQNSKNTEQQLKSTNQVLIGAFRVNQVNLLYNTTKNAFNFIVPTYNSTNNNGETEKKGFFIPKTSQAYSQLENKLESVYKEKKKILETTQNEKNVAKNIESAKNTETKSTTQQATTQAITQ